MSLGSIQPRCHYYYRKTIRPHLSTVVHRQLCELSQHGEKETGQELKQNQDDSNPRFLG